jgi:HlyD family secretion protein
MKSKLSTLKIFLKKISKKKRTWIILSVVLIIFLIIISKPNPNIKNVVSETAKLIDLKQTVLATGQVVSNTDLNLSFNSSGIVKSIKVLVGDKVKAGQVLATLEQGTAAANLTSARGSLAAANAKLKKVMEGTEVTLAKIAIDSAKINYENTKKTQETLVKNAYNNLLNSTFGVSSYSSSDNYISPTVSGTYNLSKEGQIIVEIDLNDSFFQTHGLITTEGNVSTTTPQPIGSSGLYIQFPSNETLNFTDWVIEIPNKKATDYLTNYNAYQSALETQQNALDQASALVDQRQVEYNSKLTSSIGSDVDIAQAEVLSAQGQVEQALAKYNDTQIKAPADGTITSVEIKLGELASALEKAIVLQDVSNMYIESNINEANIVGLTVGMPVEITFDAFGVDKIFQGKIISLDPSSTLISGVVNYKIKVSVEQVQDLRPGMTANMTIKVKEKDKVIAVPSRSILTNKDGSKTIRIITNSKKKKYQESPITTGLNGDGGLVEVTSGLSVGDEYVVLVKTK